MTCITGTILIQKWRLAVRENRCLMYIRGDGVTRDPVKAIDWSQRAAVHGNVESQIVLGLIYADGDGVIKDLAMSFTWFQRAAEQGDAVAQFYVGIMYYKGEGAPKNLVLACAWLSLAVMQDYDKAKTVPILEYVKSELTPDELAEAQALSSNWKIGDVLQRSDSLYSIESPNGASAHGGLPHLSLSELEAKAESGDAEAQLILGAKHIVAGDLTKGVNWIHKSAEQGYVFAQLQFGRMYHLGKGVRKDYVTASKWIRKAAEQGNAEAQFSLGNMYYNGMGLPRNSANAVIWWEKAAVQGDPASQGALGSSYYKGEGVSKDLVLAHAWFSLSAMQDSEYQEKAKINFAVIERELLSTEITEAKALSSQWKVGMILKRTGK